MLKKRFYNHEPQAWALRYTGNQRHKIQRRADFSLLGLFSSLLSRVDGARRRGLSHHVFD
jgi:hypothetical protein